MSPNLRFPAIGLTLALLAMAGCGDDAADSGPGGTGGSGGGACEGEACGPGPTSCSEGFVSNADSPGCAPVLPAGDCPAGTRPALGSTECVPVGPDGCAEGFEAGPGGWGCVPVLPAAACTGATIAQLGERGCQPLGDCAAPFPPAEATYFVDDDYDDTQIDETHKATLLEALAAAPAGATIAVEAGTYLGKILLSRDVTVVGRCAEQVVIDNPDGESLGFLVTEGDVVFEGVTFTGHDGAIGTDGGTVTVRDSLFDDNITAGVIVVGAGSARLERSAIKNAQADAEGHQTYGVLVQGGGQVELDSCEVAGNPFTNIGVNNPGSSAVVHRSVVRDGAPLATGPFAGVYGIGILVQDGGDLVLTESAVVDNMNDGVLVGTTAEGEPSTGRVEDSFIAGTRMNLDEGVGRGLEVSKGSSLTATDVTLAGNEDVAFIATEGATATLTRLIALGPIPDDGGPAGGGFLISDGAQVEAADIASVAVRITGVQIQRGGHLDARGLYVGDTLDALTPLNSLGFLYALGINVQSGGTADLDDFSVVRAKGVGLNVTSVGQPPGATSVVATRALIRETRLDEIGWYGRAVSVQDGATVHLSSAALLESHEVGVFVSDQETRATFLDAVIDGVELDATGRFGFGVALLDTQLAHMERLTVTGAAGVGVVAAKASGLVTDSVVARNNVGVHVQWGSSIEEGEEPPLSPEVLVIAPSTVFDDNAAKVGTGELPMPSPLDPFPDTGADR